MFTKMSLAELARYLEDGAQLSPQQEEALSKDRRRGAGLLLERYLKRRRRCREEEARLHTMLSEERNCYAQGYTLVAGVDEAGRGPLAGPVVAAAVILPPETMIEGLNDSKQLTPARRDLLFDQIRRVALGVGVGVGEVELIDRLNIFGAVMAAMRDAVAALPSRPEIVLVDGYPIRGLELPQKAIKGGDALSMSIAAASVIAKVTRDRIMLDIHRQYPAYGFDRHKGYATGQHRAALSRYGPCPAHRRSFTLNREG